MTDDDRRARRLEELREQLADAGLVEDTTREELAPGRLVFDPPLPVDTRPRWLVCAVCLRTLHPRRRIQIRPGRFVCGACASEVENDTDPKTLRYWLSRPPDERRRRLACRFRIDPMTGTAVNARLLSSYAVSDEAGEVQTVTVEASTLTQAGVPRCYWNLVFEGTIDLD